MSSNGYASRHPNRFKVISAKAAVENPAREGCVRFEKPSIALIGSREIRPSDSRFAR